MHHAFLIEQKKDQPGWWWIKHLINGEVVSVTGCGSWDSVIEHLIKSGP
jgi:hypothetical protein